MSARPSARAARGAAGRTRSKLPGGGTTTPSPIRTQRAAIAWSDTELPSADGVGYGSSMLPLSSLVLEDHQPVGFRAGLPTLVYFCTEADEKKALAFEDKVFGDDRVSLSARFFNCVRISVDDIPSASLRKQYGAHKGPSIMVLDADGKELKRMVGWKTSGSKLYSTMGSVLKSRSKLSLASILRKENTLLKKIDELHWKIEDAKFDLGELAERKGKSADRQRARLRTQIAELEKEYEKLLAEEEAFLKAADDKVAATDD